MRPECGGCSRPGVGIPLLEVRLVALHRSGDPQALLITMSPKAVFLLHVLMAFLLIASVVSLSGDDDTGAMIASAISDAADGIPATLTSASTSSSTTSPSKSSRKKSKAEKAEIKASKLAAATATASSRPPPPVFPSAAAVGGMACVVPLCAVGFTLIMVAFRLYLNRVEDEEEYLRERNWEKSSFGMEADMQQGKLEAHQKDLDQYFMGH
ncbi:hypothetical protein P280DRAFT_232000 [Massarina eburnea CBS 473.64]|uniref:Uncharacterized protein n=1 Tax=Massarina eburnea CBS 473.64 TaxID=1395130 RepID=A0A6A6RHH7_9PLEO|nr:hypothetical protein P280DRAFT_232000 [Massarina eburnea CBS 473.64]